MGFYCRILLGIAVLAIAMLYKQYKDMESPIEVPTVDLHQYWGRGDAANYKEDTSILPYTVYYPNPIIADLQYKIESFAKMTPPLEGAAFEYGFNTNELKKIIDYWSTEYLPNWNQREAYFNQFPHYITQIQGLDIHYIHVKPNANCTVPVYPIILLHGWPGSVREFYELIPKLVSQTADKKFVFEVIVPSLPGYGWSQGAYKTGLGPLEIAVVFRNLMLRLGHKEFFVQGGDWGSVIGSRMAAVFPEHVIGYHTNFCGSFANIANVKLFITSLWPKYFVDEQYVDWIYPMLPNMLNLVGESGYMHIQATKPDTIGTALLNNPVGLCAYILEKFSTWTNPNYREVADGGLTKYYSLDALLDNVMVYYLTNSITTSVRLYAEFFTKESLSKEHDRIPIKPPVACARFRYELIHLPDFVLQDKYTNMIQSTWKNDGGHFAAMQLPDVLYEDMVNFVGKIKHP